MRWEDERYVRLYTRDSPDWLSLSFEAQGLFCLLLRKLDRTGVLPLGKAGKRSVAIAIGHGARWADLEKPLEELLTDGCIQVTGNTLIVPNFLEAQEALASDKQRAREYRARVRDGLVTSRGASVTPRDVPVTPYDAGVTSVTDPVTPSRAVPSRAVLSRTQLRANGNEIAPQLGELINKVTKGDKLPEPDPLWLAKYPGSSERWEAMAAEAKAVASSPQDLAKRLRGLLPLLTAEFSEVKA